jgi:hypothetical protein
MASGVQKKKKGARKRDGHAREKGIEKKIRM